MVSKKAVGSIYPTALMWLRHCSPDYLDSTSLLSPSETVPPCGEIGDAIAGVAVGYAPRRRSSWRPGLIPRSHGFIFAARFACLLLLPEIELQLSAPPEMSRRPPSVLGDGAYHRRPSPLGKPPPRGCTPPVRRIAPAGQARRPPRLTPSTSSSLPSPAPRHLPPFAMALRSLSPSSTAWPEPAPRRWLPAYAPTASSSAVAAARAAWTSVLQRFGLILKTGWKVDAITFHPPAQGASVPRRGRATQWTLWSAECPSSAARPMSSPAALFSRGSAMRRGPKRLSSCSA